MIPGRLRQRPANPLRGEVDLELPGLLVRLRPTFGALVAAEGELGSLARVLERAGDGDARLADAAALFWHCAAFDGERVEFEQRLAEAGLARLLPVYRRLLSLIFTGG